MADEDVIEARSAEGLAPILEVLRDQVFQYADLLHDAKAGTLALSVLKKFPPRKGNWVLRFRGVRSVKVDHKARHVSDTLKAITYETSPDPEAAGLVRIRCVLDEILLAVDRLEVQAERYDAGAGEPKPLRREDLPEWFQKELREKDVEKEAEYERVREVRKAIRAKGAITASVIVFLMGILAGGHPLLLLVTCLLFAGGAGWLLLGTTMSPQTLGPLWGLAGLFALVAGGTGNIVALLFGALVLICGGIALGIWLRGEEDLRK